MARVTSSRTAGGTTLACDNLAGWPTVTKVHFSTYQINTSGAVVAGTQIDWYGIVSGNNITNLTRLAGATDAGNSIGDVVEAMPTGSWAQGLYDWGTSFADTQGNLLTTAVQTALSLGTATLNGWNALGFAPATVTANGNRSYDLVFNSQDLTGTLSAGMRLRTTRTVAAPTQSTSLNGTTQFYSKTSPAGMTFTNNFVAGAWVKASSYPATDVAIMSRFNGTSGWILAYKSTGQISLQGYNAAGSNASTVTSYQSIPLNKWVYVSAQLDMSTFTATTTTSYVMIDGVDVPASVSRSGTNPTALIQAGNLEIGSFNAGAAGSFFPGKIAQAFVSSAKITQANIRTLYSQGLTSALITANSIISAYSFNNSINDLNTTNANNLTANGSAVATNADSPFGGQADGTISSTLDYAIVQKTSFSTNTTITVQVPEGCTIPTSGGVASVVYSSNKAPYGMPIQKDKWSLYTYLMTPISSSSNATYNTFNGGGYAITPPVGAWNVGMIGDAYTNSTTQVTFNLSPTSLTGLTAQAGLAKSRMAWSIQSPSAAVIFKGANVQEPVTLSVATTYTVQSIGSTTAATLQGDVNQNCLFAENAYL